MRRANATRTAGLCLAWLLCLLTGCSSKASSPDSSSAPTPVSGVTLPASLAHEPIQLQQIIDLQETLTPEQLRFVLRKFLAQWSFDTREKQEASYMLGISLQNANNRDDWQSALTAFQTSKNLASLKRISLWHASEVAALIGKEKVVRELLDEILKESRSDEDRARAEYALAQSYLRANEPDRAQAAFESVQKQYAGSPYAIGCYYYLGELAWGKATTQKPANASGGLTIEPARVSDNSSSLSEAASLPVATTAGVTSAPVPALIVEDAVMLKKALGFFGEYLRQSPAGHFAENARARLRLVLDAERGSGGGHGGAMPLQFTNGLMTDAQVDTLAYSHYVDGQWGKAQSLWASNLRDRRLVEIANCQAHMRQREAARATLLQAVKLPGNAVKYASVADFICQTLSKEEATKFWQQILQSLPKNKDAALWNIAIRLSPPASLPYLKSLVTNYPNSRYAAEAHWWLFWEAAQHTSGKDIASLVRQADSLSQKYKTSRAASRFLFWAGKLSEQAHNSKQASAEYRKLQQLYGSDYYAFRAAERLGQLQKKPLAFGWLKKHASALPQEWTLPEPSSFKSNGLNETARELIKLRAYNETLPFLASEDSETRSWLLAKLHQPLLAIATASKQLKETPLSATLWQYAYPLLYASDIQDNCRQFSNVDPLLMHALVREESHYDPNAISSSKAIGLTQVMPGTAYGVAKLLKIKVTNPSEFFNPQLNLKLGTEYFSGALSRFQNNSLYAVASYNGGAGAVKGWISKEHAKGKGDYDAFVENIPFRETRDYVRKVFASYWNYLRLYGKQN